MLKFLSIQQQKRDVLSFLSGNVFFLVKEAALF